MCKYRVAIMACAVILRVAPVLADTPEWLCKEDEAIRAHRLNGSGRWAAAGNKRGSLQRWSLNVERDDDGKLDGTVVIDNSPLLKSGVVGGSMHGRHLSGTIGDASGAEIAEFRGVIAPDGVRGTYTDRTGETGEWVWDGPLPE